VKPHAIIRTPIPTTEEVARELGVPMRRVRELQKLVEEVVVLHKDRSAGPVSDSRKFKVRARSKRRARSAVSSKS